MSWQTITLTVPEELKDAIVGEFSSDGIAGVWERDLPSREDDAVELVLYFEPGHPPPLVDARVGRVFERNGYDRPSVAVGRQEKEDWTREWRKGFTSFSVGTRFQAVPSWEDPSVAKERIPIRIDPGLAFGTGTHETTRLVLEVLESLEPADQIVLDLGTGSAILSIGAVKLGHSSVIGCDIDSDAVQVARQNVRRNDSNVSVFVGSVDAIATRSVRLVLANITADVIGLLLPDISRVMEVGGAAVFSGILDTQADAVRREISAAGFVVQLQRTLGEWAVMSARRSA